MGTASTSARRRSPAFHEAMRPTTTAARCHIEALRDRSDAPDKILRSDSGCLNGGTDKTASGQPYSPRSANDAQSQTEGDAEVGIAVRRHVGEDLAPPGVAVLRLTGVVRHRCVRSGLARLSVVFFHARPARSSSASLKNGISFQVGFRVSMRPARARRAGR